MVFNFLSFSFFCILIVINRFLTLFSLKGNGQGKLMGSLKNDKTLGCMLTINEPFHTCRWNVKTLGVSVTLFFFTPLCTEVFCFKTVWDWRLSLLPLTVDSSQHGRLGVLCPASEGWFQSTRQVWGVVSCPLCLYDQQSDFLLQLILLSFQWYVLVTMLHACEISG